MKFGPSQKMKFNTENGAYSIVTQRENHDSQITATDEEARVLVDFFNLENIQVGNVKSNPGKSNKAFKLYPNGEIINLNLVFPKPGNNELRLYLSEKAGFKPESNDIWFVFVLNGELWLGFMDESNWRNKNQILIYDESEGDYQDSLQELDDIKINTLKARDIFKRDKRLAIERMILSNYKCEYNDQHDLFLSRTTNMPFLEAHHLIPISLQSTTRIPLDTIDNIYSLCPYCHRAIHHAERALSKNIIEVLVIKRPNVLNILNNNLNDILNCYAVEDIE